MGKYVTLLILLLFLITSISAQVIISANVQDLVAPVTTLSGCNNSWNKVDQNITLTCTDVNGSGCNQTKYRIDSNTIYYLYSAPFPINTDGNKKIDYNSNDLSGNIEAIKTSYCAVDKTAPVTTISGCLSGTSHSSQTLALACTDATSGCSTTSYSIDSGTTTSYSGSFILNTDGNHRIDFNSIDSATNTESVKTSYCYVNYAPGVTILDPNGGEIFKKLVDNPTIILSLQDQENDPLLIDLNYSDSNVQGTGYRILLNDPISSENWLCEDSNFINPVICYYLWNITDITDGNYYLLAEVSDAGRSGTDVTDDYFVIGEVPTAVVSEDYNQRYITGDFTALSETEKQTVLLEGMNSNIFLVIVIILIAVVLIIGWFLWKRKQQS